MREDFANHENPHTDNLTFAESHVYYIIGILISWLGTACYITTISKWFWSEGEQPVTVIIDIHSCWSMNTYFSNIYSLCCLPNVDIISLANVFTHDATIVINSCLPRSNSWSKISIYIQNLENLLHWFSRGLPCCD